MPSAIVGEDTGKSVQLVGTPLARVIGEEKKIEEKEETRDEEQSAI